MEKRQLFKLSIVAASILAPSFQLYASTPYPNVPVNWQAGTISVKPNILLFLDTSGSMKETDVLDTDGTYKARIQVAKNVISDVITGTREKNRWGLATFIAGDSNSNSSIANISSGTLIPQTFYGNTYSNYTYPPLSGGQNQWLYHMTDDTGASSLTGYFPMTRSSNQNIYYTDSGTASYNTKAPIWQVNGAQILMNISDVDASSNNSNYQSLLNQIQGMTPLTGTPIPSAYYELLRYYRGMTPGIPGLPTPDGKSTYTSPIQYRCQKNNIIFISDGAPTGLALQWQLGTMYHLDPWFNGTNSDMYQAQPSAGQAAATDARKNALSLRDTAADTSVTPAMAEAAYKGDLLTTGTDAEGGSFQDSKYPYQNITTYTVGFAGDNNLLNNMAAKGGGSYFLATSGDALKAALTSALSSISRDAGYTASTVSANSTGSKVSAAAATTMDPASWTSQLRFYPYVNGAFDLTTYTVPKYTNSDASLTSRALLSSDSGVTAITQDTVPNNLSNTTFGIGSNRTTTIAKSSDATEYQRLLAWLLRWKSKDIADSSYQNYRDRNAKAVTDNAKELARYMGDVTGNVLQLGKVTVPAASASDFDRKEFLAVPSNDGMMHIFTANTGTDKTDKPYLETLQYIPGTVQRNDSTDTFLNNLVSTAESDYGSSSNPKQSFLAGESYAVSGTDGEVSLLHAFGQGGRGVFSLMLGGTNAKKESLGLNLDSSQWTSSVPLWDMSTTQYGGAGNFYTKAGYNIGIPKVGYVSNNGQTWSNTTGNVRAAALVTGGMDNPTSTTPALYVLDHFGIGYGTGGLRQTGVTPGTLIKEIPIGRSYTATASTESTAAQLYAAHDGLTSVQAIDLNGDSIMDLAYAGDYKGNIWRFDLRGDVSTWKARQIFQGTGTQPLTAEPNLAVYTENGKKIVGVYFGTGSTLYQGDMTVNAPQSMYGVFDHVSDCAVDAAYSGVCAVAKKSDLISQSLSGSHTAGYSITTSNTYSSNGDRRGFYLDTPSGYRIITTPEVVKVKGRSSYSLVWAIEYLDSSKSSSSNTCTPSSTTYGDYLITNAETGDASKYVSWKSNTNSSIISLPYTGTSSQLSLLTNTSTNSDGSASVLTSTGTLNTTGGTLASPDNPTTTTTSCSNTGVIAATSSVSGIVSNTLTCDGTGPSIKRISWREIF